MAKLGVDVRSNVINVRIESPKVQFLANLAARYHDKTLAEFVEDALKLALSPAAMRTDEPKVVEPTGPIEEPVLWNDGMWDQDEAVRAYRLSIFHHNLLVSSQRRIWSAFSSAMMKEGKPLTQQNFVEFYNAQEGQE